uniref:Formyltetrahydrofolate deformylase n=1 Tax=Candidatus Kentrum sp. TUN TaxID=2126343 RepID=A0A451AE31_9GAMM|nr:MAG: formyltetrahydrofolate deformylase [Candidatus Kentron sp. TUN]VFK64297.1 MAG: formyltetrahydrofolate deformylase [Candidatus Kentron sp. TUN]
MTAYSGEYILKFRCPDRLGIVAAVAGFLAGHRCNIVESAQFGDKDSQQFFMRTVFATETGIPTLPYLKTDYSAIGDQFSMDWDISDAGIKPRVLILVSKLDHCLDDLLYRYRTGAIAMEIPAIVSNHPDLAPLADFHGIPYHYLPVNNDNRAVQESHLLKIITETNTDLIVLARYMQILSPHLCKQLSERVINIHHSFLPSFRGARPYHQAHARGVKLIGATAHYVTEFLDEGPIIEQDTVRVTHAYTPKQLITLGEDLENLVLARAVKLHCEHRILLNGNKTVVF